MTLRARCLLAENAEEILTTLLRGLAAQGVRVEMARDDEEPDLLYACGLLTAERIAAGAPYDVVAVPLLAGEDTAHYRSVLVTTGGPVAGRMAVNEYGSWSGWRGYLADGNPEPAAVVLTGAHLGSIDAVLDGRADFAAIDSSVWAWAFEHRPAVRSLTVAAETNDWPAPPLSISTELAEADRVALLTALLRLPRVAAATTSTYLPMLGA